MIDDLLPLFPAAVVEHRKRLKKHQGNWDTPDPLAELFAVVQQRIGMNISKCDPWNATIYFLDKNYPNWRIGHCVSR